MTHLEPFHALSIEEVFRQFKTSEEGLSSEEVARRQKLFGKNILKEEKVGLVEIFFRQFKSIPIYILFFAALVSILIGEWVDFCAIMGVISLNGGIGFWQELKAEVSIAALKKMTESKNRVLRGGKQISIASSELVPGDYLVLREGELVTADVRLTGSSGLMVDESPMTGESTPVIKNHAEILPKDRLPYELDNMLLAGTIVVRGEGRGIVVRTNGKTYLAAIAEKVQDATPPTPLNRALNFFMKRFIAILIAIFILLGIVGFLQGRDLLDLNYILLAGLVSSVPEGLPIVVTLVMVLGALALSRQKTLIRYLPSVETLGSVTILASDKTGTITEGKLIVKEIYTRDEALLKRIAALCNDAKDGIGDPLDVALSQWAGEHRHPRLWAHPFDTQLMLMATVHEGEELFIKGAFEALRDKAEHYQAWEAPLAAFLEKGLRVIALGRGKWEGNRDPASWKIEIIGLIGFLDPPKEGVLEAVSSAKRAGIHVIMITGDHPMTARAVAKEVGIWKEGDRILTGREIADFSNGELLEAIKKATVLARVLPEHKYRVVKSLQDAKEIVAVTGDGVNDVPALKIADIGIAMGSGTEAAKGVSKMVITDNNLRIIVEAIRNARVIADNIRKVIYYLVGTTVLEVVLLILAILSYLPLPLFAIQILWINLIGDGVQDKTFPFTKEEGNVMNRKPRKPETQFFDLLQIVRIFSFGCGVGLLCFLLYLYLINQYPPATVSTIIFTSVAVAQWANGIQAQKASEPFFKNITRSFTINPYIYVGIGVGIALLCLVIYLIPELFHLTPIGFAAWKYPLFIFLAAFFSIELRKWTERWFLGA